MADKWPLGVSTKWKVIASLLALALIASLYVWWPIHSRAVIAYDDAIVKSMYLSEKQSRRPAKFAAQSGLNDLAKLEAREGVVQGFRYIRSYADLLLEPTLHVYQVQRSGKWKFELSVVSHSKVVIVVPTTR